jgi:hypothetical protein
VHWHLAPGTRLRLVPGGAAVSAPAGALDVAVTADGEPQISATTAPLSAGFGRTSPAPVLTCTLQQELPVQISTVWRRAEPRQEPA